MLNQRLSLKLQQKLSPQQIQLMKLLQIPTMELEQRIKEEMEINPALEEGEETDDELEEATEDTDEELKDEEEETPENEEELEEEKQEELKDEEDHDIDDFFDEDDDGIPDYKLSANNTSPDDERKEVPIVGTAGFQDALIEQLGMRRLDDRQHTIALHILGNIDDDGYLRRELPAMTDDLAFGQNITTTEKELDELLHIIQQFDPPGVGARDLRECLLLQLKRREHSITNHTAIVIIDKMMDEFIKKHYDKISKELELEPEDLKDAIGEILKLNPRPGNTMADNVKSVSNVVPDFIITNNEGVLELNLNQRNAPALKISKEYKEMLKEYGGNKKNQPKEMKDATVFIKQKIDAAKWFIDAIEQRQQTLLITMDAIMNFQTEYFLTGDETKLKPMILKDISEIVGLDISTISRVSNSKYAQTQFGTFLIKSFFSESLSNDEGEEVSSREVKKILSETIAAEDKRKPVPDDKLAQILKEKGYNIARRTVAKYREMLNIPVARLRREL